MAHLIQLDVTCKFGQTMQLICHSILICSIFHRNWRVAHLIQFDVTCTLCKFGLTMQLICRSILICSIFHLNWRVAHLIQLDVTCKFEVLKTNICPRSEASRATMLVLRTSNFQGATIRPIVPRHKHSIVFIVHY